MPNRLTQFSKNAEYKSDCKDLTSKCKKNGTLFRPSVRFNPNSF
jgi:hypothetical protein